VRACRSPRGAPLAVARLSYGERARYVGSRTQQSAVIFAISSIERDHANLYMELIFGSLPKVMLQALE
jgi:hypothetical protein